MNETKRYHSFKISFHACILVFAIGVIIASISGWHEMNRALFYLVLGLCFAAESIFVLVRNFTHKSIQ